MKITIKEPTYLKENLTLISSLINEATFKLTQEGIKMTAMDPANVAMILFELNPEMYEGYTEDSEFCVSIKELLDIIKRCKPDDSIILEMKDNLICTILGKVNKRYEIPIFDDNIKETKIPNLDFKTKVWFDSTLLKEVMDDFKVLHTDAMKLIVTDGKFNIRGESDLKKLDLGLSEDSGVQVSQNEPIDVMAKYSTEYIKKMISQKLSRIVTLQFNTDYPLQISYIEKSKFKLDIILAPRVEND